jgi:hypothetical protein
MNSNYKATAHLFMQNEHFLIFNVHKDKEGIVEEYNEKIHGESEVRASRAFLIGEYDQEKEDIANLRKNCVGWPYLIEFSLSGGDRSSNEGYGQAIDFQTDAHIIKERAMLRKVLNSLKEDGDVALWVYKKFIPAIENLLKQRLYENNIIKYYETSV